MKEYMKNILKTYSSVYFLYYRLVSLFINIIRVFIKTDNKIILFNSFGGEKYDDSPKSIYVKMIEDKRFTEYKFIWAFSNTNKFDIPVGQKIKIDTFQYYMTALKARCWITNSGIERGLNFKGKNTYYFNTWHGTPIKVMGSDLSNSNKSFKSKAKSKVDNMCAQSEYEADIFSRAFGIDRDKFIYSGLPRNDDLTNNEVLKKAEKLKEKLNIPMSKKIILYAPTFREYQKDSNAGYKFISPINFEYLKNKIGSDFFILIRAHYAITSEIDAFKNNDFMLNVSDYPNLNELMIVSDMLISDYSSMFFDYSILEKPMIAYTYDYNEYAKKRGMYFDIREVLDYAQTEDELVKKIQGKLDNKKTIDFKSKYVRYSGEAVNVSLDTIYHNIN